MAAEAADHRRATAERNVEAILTAVESLLGRGAAATTTAVAAEAGVSRVTVYAHFPTREALLAAVIERAVEHVRAALADPALTERPAVEALDRLVETGWREIARRRAIAEAAHDLLGGTAVRDAHQALHTPLAAFVERGRAEGAFRTDVSTHWLVASYFALMHAARDEVLAGTMAPDDVVPTLQATLRGVFTG